ncbi:vacuolar protein sorting-associated protein 37D isoform X2 [Pantherophis guttatus]|uniref:Vacuolar protein sorting-associated protein 37D isoform X2 n=1 Tax=Pantherophis guttatus TaxID=94885 RepID=A0A6P9CAP7_PANGU|nr:vacuolar protein sorting-associated protein 37D isoform X2 [Pantherophis guttatus]
MERDRGPRASAVDLGFGALSTAQLRALMRDETWLERIVKLSRKFQNLQLEREVHLASNYNLAKQNLGLQPRLENGKASLAIKYQELQELRETCHDKQQRLGACMAKWTPENALSRLQAELENVEAKVEWYSSYGTSSPPWEREQDTWSGGTNGAVPMLGSPH